MRRKDAEDDEQVDDLDLSDDGLPDPLPGDAHRFDGEPWGRQPHESPQAYGAFEVYLMLGAQRSNAKVSREVKKSKALMDRWSSRWLWVKRAELYDTEQHRLWETEVAIHRREAAKRHVANAQALQNAAMKALKAKFGANFEKIDADSLKNGDLLRFIVEATKIERQALGEPGEIIESPAMSGESNNDRKPIVPLTFAGRIDEALALLETARTRAVDATARPAD